MTQKEKLIKVGRLGASYGVKGWVKINSFTEIPENIFNYPHWIINHNGKFIETQCDCNKVRAQSLICKLPFINSLEEAKEYVNDYIYIPVSDLPSLENEFYWIDLTGCKVFNTDGYYLGIVKSILETGANDVLVLDSDINDQFGIKERLIPFETDYFVKNIDTQNKKIIVNWDPEF